HRCRDGLGRRCHRRQIGLGHPVAAVLERAVGAAPRHILNRPILAQWRYFMTTVRIGTFNVENLFSRAKALNKRSFEATARRLAKIGDLENELAKKTYDKDRIIELYREVKDYISFNVTRSEGRKSIVLFDRRTGKFKVDVKGRDDWEGFI